MVERIVLSCLALGFLMGVVMQFLPKLIPAKVIPGCEFSYDFSSEEHTTTEQLIELWPKREECAEDTAFNKLYQDLAKARCEEFFDSDSANVPLCIAEYEVWRKGGADVWQPMWKYER